MALGWCWVLVNCRRSADTFPMQATLVMTVIGPDRTGLVESVAQVVAQHDGNWLESRMCRLDGEFAGLVRVVLPVSRQAALETALAQLPGLTVVVRNTAANAAAAPAGLAQLEVIGPDRPGIVREITRALRAQGINVEELTTECRSAPMSGESLFQARARISVPPGVALVPLRQTLEASLAGFSVELGRVESVA